VGYVKPHREKSRPLPIPVRSKYSTLTLAESCEM
jgi:hypothetical protein